MNENQRSTDRNKIPWLQMLAIGALSFLLLCVIGAVLVVSNSKASTIGTLRSGRKVMVSSNSMFLETKFKKDTAIIQTGGREIVVRPDSVWMDNSLVEKIDPRSKDVKIRYNGGELSVEWAKLPETDTATR